MRACLEPNMYYQTRRVYKTSLLRASESGILSPVMDEIAKQIQALCDATGLSQADVARQLGVPPKTLNDWLPTGTRAPRTRCRHQQMLALAVEALTARLRR